MYHNDKPMKTKLAKGASDGIWSQYAIVTGRKERERGFPDEPTLYKADAQRDAPEEQG